MLPAPSYLHMNTQESLRIEPWMRGVLLLAGFYNLGWGFFIYNFPDSFYQWVTLSDKTALPVITWQGLGVLVFGVVYIITAVYPIKLWFLLVIGLLSKLAGALWFFLFIMEGVINKKFLFHIIMNDLIWVIPFGVILWRMMIVRNAKKEHAI